MADQDDVWHSVSMEENEEYDIVVEKKKKDQNETKLNLFSNILKVLVKIDNVERNFSNEKNLFLQYIDLSRKYTDKSILFGKLIYLGIKAKLFVIIDQNSVKYQLHVFLPEIIEHEKIKTSGLVFTIYSTGTIVNETILHSSKYKFFAIFDTLISEIRPVVVKMQIFKNTRNLFTVDVDQKIIFKKIPNSINRFRHHPLYVVESILSKDEYVHPMRPVLGYFKGEPVYLRTNVKKYQSEASWFRKGRKIKENCKKKFHLIKEKKLYRIYETEDIFIPDITDKTMKYFHKNHIPSECCYIDHENASEIALLLQIKYAECIIGYTYKGIIKKGIFCYKKDENHVRDALHEYEFNQKLTQYIENGKSFFKAWDRVLKKTKRFLELKDAFD